MSVNSKRWAYELILDSHRVEELVQQILVFEVSAWFVTPVVTGGTGSVERIGDELSGASHCILRVMIDPSRVDLSLFETTIRTLSTRHEAICLRSELTVV